MTEPDSDSTRADQPTRATRWLWRGLPLAVLIAIRAVLPFALERAIPWLAKREIGAEIRIENIDLGLIGGAFLIEGLRVASPSDSGGPEIPEPTQIPPAAAVPAATPEPTAAHAARPIPEDLFSLARLQLEIDWLELIGKRVSLPLIQLDGLTLRVHQNRDGSFALPTPPPGKSEEHLAKPTAPDPSDDLPLAEITPAPGESEKNPEQAAAPSSGGDAVLADPASAPEASNETSSETSGADATAGTADGWPIRIGRLELNQPDLAVYSERTGSEVARFTLTRFAVDAFTSGSAGFGLGDIALEGPAVFVERDWLFDPGLGGDGTAEPRTASRTPGLKVERLSLSSGHFQIRSAHGPIESAIQIEILKFDTTPGQTFPIEIALEVGEGGVSLNGRLGIFPPSFEGKLSWRELRVPPYLLLTTPAIAPWLASCNAEGRLELSFHSQTPAQLAFRGEARLSNLAFRQPETGELALEIQQMSMQLREAIYPLETGRPRRLDFASLEIAKPKVVFTNPPDALDDLIAIFAAPRSPEGVAGVEPPTGDAPAATGSRAEPPPLEPEAGSTTSIAIEKLKLSDGDLVFVDRSVKPQHETHIRDFRLDAAGVTSSPAGVERIEMAGLIQRQGTFEIKGKLPRGNGSLRLEVRRLDLASYNGFARRAALNLHSGEASLESAIEVADGRYQADNDLVLHDLRVDATKPGAFASTFGVSLDFALALLRGPRGDIELALPVTFDKAGAGIGIGSLIRSALKEAFAGVLTSPFKLAGGLLPSGSKPASLEAIGFDPGEIALTASAKKRIAPLVDLLRDRPGLGLTVRGQTAAADERGLAYALLRDRAVAGEGLPEFEGAGFFARRRLTSALRARAEGGSGALDPADEALLTRYVDAQQVPNERHEALARARAQSVLDALIAAGAPAEALTLGASERAEPPGVVLGLGLRARAETGPSESSTR